MMDFDSIFNKKKQPTAQMNKAYRINNRDIKEQKLLSEGAFGYIWKAIDINTKQVFALKKVICSSKQRLDHAKAQMETMKKLKPSPHVVKFYGGSIEKESNGNPVVLTLMQLCPNGSLFDLMASRQDKGFTQKQLLKIIETVALGIKCVHESGFAHRDIKIQNVILSTDNTYKLCDFGSCTTKQVDFNQISTSNYSDYDDQFQTNTTPMYRPPEIVDPFKKYKVNRQVDVWMLGCVLYTLIYFTHPFIDASKAGIANAAFRISADKCSQKLNDLIRNMLTPNPANRININQLLTLIQKWDSYTQIPLNREAKQIKQQWQKKEKQLSVFNKKTVQYSDDIPIQVLMKLQNQLKQKQEQPITTFKTQNNPKLLQKFSAPPIQSKSSQPINSNTNAFNQFSFNNLSIPKPSVSSWNQNDDFFKQTPIQKSQSLGFDFFVGNTQSSLLQTQNSNQDKTNIITSQYQFYQFFKSDSTIKTPNQSNSFDFL